MGQLLLEEVPSLAYKNSKGQIKRTNSAGRINDLDSTNIPFPARHLLPMENYIGEQEAHGAVNGRWTTIISSRESQSLCELIITTFPYNNVLYYTNHFV